MLLSFATMYMRAHQEEFAKASAQMG